MGEIVDEQVAELGCSPTLVLSDTVAVRNAVGFARVVVRIVRRNRARASALTGAIWIVG